MKKSFLLGGAVAASLVLAACGGGGSPAAKGPTGSTGTTGSNGATTVSQLLSSTTASPYLQLTLSGSGSGFTSTKDEGIAKDVSLQINLASTSGGSLTANGKSDAEIFVNISGAHLLDIRSVGSDLFVELDATALSGIGEISSAELTEVQAVLGGKWYEIPDSLITSKLPKNAQQATAKSAADKADAMAIAHAISNALASASHTTLSGGGFTETGMLEALFTAIEPSVKSIDPTAKEPKNVKGTYTVTVTASGSSVTGATVSVTAPDPPSTTDATVSLTLTVAHASDSIAAPGSSTLVTPTLIKDFEGLGKA